MPFDIKTKLSSPPTIFLLRAIGAPPDFRSVANAAPLLTSCIKAAAQVWPVQAIANWEAIAREIQYSISFAKEASGDQNIQLFAEPTDLVSPFNLFLKWHPPLAPSGFTFNLHALLGRALIVAASRGQVLHSDFLAGCQTLKLAAEGKGRRSADWDQLKIVAILSSETIQSVLSKVGRTSPTLGFLNAALTFLESPLQSPVLPDEKENEANVAQPKGAEHGKAVQQGTSPNAEAQQSDQVESTQEEKDVSPDIAARLAAADYSSFGEKLGIYHRDQLLVGDLAQVTHQLILHMEEGSKKNQAYAVLALVSLVTGSTDVFALKLEFKQRQSIWLDLELQAWAWDFQAYRSAKVDRAYSPTFEPVFIPMPVKLSDRLTQAKLLKPDATTLEELIEEIHGEPEIDLKEFRNFLRSCGHPAHPPYRGRFARSMPGVYLEVTGSDMTSALMTGFFSATAPAALFYYGPQYSTLTARVGQVYDRLGLGAPSEQLLSAGRAACKKILEPHDLQLRWNSLVDAIEEERLKTINAQEQESFLIHANYWMRLMSAALVIQSAHRGTRLECLTFGALFLHPDVILVNDKEEEGDRAQPRLVPATPAISALLSSCLECHGLVQQRLNLASTRFTLAPKLDDPALVQWKVNGDITAQSPVTTSMILEVTQLFFNSSHNFGRSQWVTALDEYSCDRWLIRSLTGHTRDVARTHGAYMDIPPLIAAEHLNREMQKVGELIFGNRLTPSCHPQKLELPLLIPKNNKTYEEANDRVIDPRLLLAPFSVETLLRWRVSEQVRHAFVDGDIDATKHVLAVLHLIFIDQIPDIDLCATAVSERHKYFKTYSNRMGILWDRPYFIHPTWIPVQPTAALLLEMLDADVPAPHELKREVCTFLRRIDKVSWPPKDTECWVAISETTKDWRRLAFGPSMNAVSDLCVPAPTLSDLSLQRLAGIQIPISSIQISSMPRRSASRHADDLKQLIRCLNKYSSKVKRLGERRKRAIDCLKEIEELAVTWTQFGSWIREWVVDELRMSRDGIHGCYQISSIGTYLSTLLLAQNSFDHGDDPDEWEESEWLSWVEYINLKCEFSTANFKDNRVEDLLHERAKNALNALIASLKRREQHVPAGVYSVLGLSRGKMAPHGSASSTLISRNNVQAALAQQKIWYADYPSDFILSDIRGTLSLETPLRGGDLSSLKSACLTPSGGLVIERVGYNNHKTRSAIRVIPLSADSASSLREKHQALKEHVGEQPLMLRLDGSAESGVRDQRLTHDWSKALKIVTGDPGGRPHSVRAAAMQEHAWPGWQKIAASLLHDRAGPLVCWKWQQELHKDWTRLARSAAFAGHADLRPAIGSYMAGWPLIFSIMTTATLVNLVPKPKFFRQLGIDPATMRQAKLRSTRTTNASNSNPDDFCSWSWLMEHHARRLHRQAPPPEHVLIKKEPSQQAASTESEVSNVMQLVYMTVRCLGLKQGQALEKVKMPLSLAIRLEESLPSSDLVSAASRRARHAAEPRAQQANINMALSTIGIEIFLWLFSLSSEDLMATKEAFFRDGPQNYMRSHKAIFWKRVTENIPSLLAIHARIGDKHITSDEHSDFLQLAPAVLFKTNSRIGSLPVVSLELRGKENRVVNARLTTVARTACLAISALRQIKIVQSGTHAN